MDDKRLRVYTAIVVILFAVLPMIYYNAGYWAGVEDTSEEPTPLRIMTGVVLLNATTYNMSWYDIGFGDPEQQPAPTLRNDSFLMYINVNWGLSDKFSTHIERIPHVIITVVVLSFEYDMYNFTIERVVIYGRSMLGEGQYLDNFYDNGEIRIDSIDAVGIVFFGYGSCQNNMDCWITRNMVFTVSSVWYEEIDEGLPVVIPMGSV